MLEVVLHYIWQQRIFAAFPQQTTDGRKVEVISVGEYNKDAGPDFFNAHIRIYPHEGQDTNIMDWVGNVEIHIQSSDWFKHRHHLDKGYNNVILHVVNQADKEVYNTLGEKIVQCELNYPKNVDYLSRFFSDKNSQCYIQLQHNPALLTDNWKNVLLNDRMKRKEEAIFQLLDMTQNHWENAFYVTLAHNFGFHTNGQPFELLAKQTPLSCLNKHRNNLFQLTALLLGQSGLLLKERNEEEEMLYQEYLFLQKKFSLQPLEAHLWKKLRMRPQTFPEVRIRQFAFLMYRSEFLFSQAMQARDIDTLLDLFTFKPDADEKLPLPPPLGKDSVYILLINSVIPYQYAYAHEHGDREKANNAVRLLDDIPAENNHIVRKWKLLGQKVQNATDSQVLIHLHNNYCLANRCVQCEIGFQIFATKDKVNL